MCLVCEESIAVLKDYILSRHFQTKHAEKYRNMYFEQRASKSCFLSCTRTFDNCIQKTTELQELAMYCPIKVINMASISLRANELNPFLTLQQYFALTKKRYLSRQTVTRCVEDFSENMKQQLKDEVKDFTYFFLALDESSDAQLLIFLRGITPDFETEELASVQSMKSTTTGTYLLEVNKCVAKLGLSFEKLSSVTTDGCPNLTGNNIGLLKRIQDQVAEIIFLHCIIHQEVL